MFFSLNLHSNNKIKRSKKKNKIKAIKINIVSDFNFININTLLFTRTFTTLTHQCQTMASSINEIFSKDNFKKNKKLVLLSAAVALLLVAAVTGIAAGASKANGNRKEPLSPSSHAVLRSACSSTLYPELCISAVATSGGVKLTSQKDVIDVAPPTLRILVTQVTIYNIWRQRNSALHLNGFTNTEVTFKTIDREVRNTISARRHKKSFSSLMSLWIR